MPFRSSNMFPADKERMKLNNPGNLDEIVGEIALASTDTAHAAMTLAKEAFAGWASIPMEKRVKILHLALDHLESNKDKFAQSITLENGKPLAEAYSEVESALGDGRFQLNQASKLPVHDQNIQINKTISGEVWHVPMGVFLLITPWNFPLATILRKLIPAVVWGNTAVVKPAQETPFTAIMLFEILAQAGVPADVVNLVLGKGSEIGDTLVDHPALRGISFTGSTEVGTGICKRIGDRNVRLQMEMGGKNALVILNDADVDASVQAAVTAAFTCSGQWCTATSRIIVEEGIYQTFCREFVKNVAELKMGTGMDPDVNFGPVASSRQKKVAINAIKRAKEEGAQLLCGGNAQELVNGKPGYFVEPTVFCEVTASMHLFREEIFGPVVGVTRAKNARHALQLVNDSQYGLSFSVFTTDLEKADIFLKEVHCGMVHHNLHTAYRHPAMPIIGWKESGRGIPECGRYARDFYTQIKAVYRCN